MKDVSLFTAFLLIGALGAALHAWLLGRTALRVARVPRGARPGIGGFALRLAAAALAFLPAALSSRAPFVLATALGFAAAESLAVAVALRRWPDDHQP